MKDIIRLDYMNIQLTAQIAKALSSEVRLEILKTIVASPMNISEVAEKLAIPISTAAMHIRILEDSGLVVTQALPGLRGFQKVCGLKVAQVEFTLQCSVEPPVENVITQEMPIGNYFDCQIVAPCGIVSESNFISSEDSVIGFYAPLKHTAQLIWLSKGYLEYRFTNHHVRRIHNIKAVEFSFEICSEAPAYNNTWKSDVSIWINGHELGAVRCLGDYGGRKGKLNPDWWSLDYTQYGEMHTVRLTPDGCYIDEKHCGSDTLETLGTSAGDFISLKIGVKDSAKYVGGLNLFGEKFGDYEQNILMKIIY